jgi:hypothetical protein
VKGAFVALVDSRGAWTIHDIEYTSFIGWPKSHFKPQ